MANVTDPIALAFHSMQHARRGENHRSDVKYIYPAIFSVAALIGVLAAGALLYIGLSAMAPSGTEAVPRGPGWITLPFVAALGGWRYGERFNPKTSAAAVRLKADGLSGSQRLWIGGAAIWVALCVMFFAAFHPLGYYWTSTEWTQFLFICGAPIVSLFLATKVLDWSSRG